ncbi:MAG: hypothetical protein K0R50_4509 [Eubacterium sp.]|nr:hypothetical protein [Eubacterium sp.]
MPDTINEFLSCSKGFFIRIGDSLNTFFEIMDAFLKNRLYLSLILIGSLFILAGVYISIYKNSLIVKTGKIGNTSFKKHLRLLENLIYKFPFKLLSIRLEKSLSYFMLQECTLRNLVMVSTLIIPVIGLLIYLALLEALTLWYTKLVTLVLCMMVPYYVFTLIADYMKYSLKLKIPTLIDSFRSSFMMHYRIKPALLECSKNIDRSLGRIISRASDCSDLNESLSRMREKVNDTWFNIFVLLLVNYRENGGELIAQLYKLNRTITRYNNIEKKKNKRLIWYEVFTVAASIFSLPVILLLNKIILGVNPELYYDSTSSFARIAIYSLGALLVVRILRKM